MQDNLESDGYISNGEDGDDESESSDLKENSSPEEETESEDNSTEEEAYSLDSEKSKKENDMPEITNSVNSDNENEMPELTNSESSSDKEEMSEVIDYSTMPELLTDYSTMPTLADYDSGEDSSETGSELEKDDRIYLITSVANLRRREVKGLETCFNERKIQLKKRQKKKRQKESKVRNASLAETQNLIKEKTIKYDRGGT